MTNKNIDKAKCRAKEAAGALTGNRRLKNEGRADHAKGGKRVFRGRRSTMYGSTNTAMREIGDEQGACDLGRQTRFTVVALLGVPLARRAAISGSVSALAFESSLAPNLD